MSSPASRSAVVFAVLLGATLLVFGPALGGGFLHWDDNHNVVFNERVHSLTGESLAWMWADVGPDLRYKPLGWTAWAVTAAVFGVDPFGFHLANLVLHLLNTALVFLLLRRLLIEVRKEDPGETGRQELWAGVGALLWALHPMRVEPVAWISCLPHHLALFFCLGATLIYLRLDFSRSVWRQRPFWAALALFALALASFPLPLGYPAVWLALNVFPLRRLRLERGFGKFSGESRRAWMEVGAATLVAVAFLVAQLWFRHEAEGHFSAPASLERFPLSERIMQGVYVWVFYFWRFFFPVHLSPVYLDLFPVEPLAFPFVFSATVLVALVAVIWKNRHQSPGALAALIAHLGILVPVLGLTEKPHFPGDRYALIDGLILAAAAVLWVWSRRLGGRRLFAALGVVLALMIVRVENYLPVWRDDVSFFRTQARQLPMPNRNPPMERLAMALASRGEHAEAELWYQLRTRDVAPEDLPFELAFMRGLNREKLGDPAGAARFYRAALARSPGRHFVMYPLGRVLFRLGEHEEAANWFEAARLVARGEAEIDLEYGRALRAAGFRERAVKVLEEGLSRAEIPDGIRSQLVAELSKAQAGADP